MLPPPRLGFIAELTIPEDADAARKTLRELVGQLDKQPNFSRVDLLSDDLRRNLAEPKVLIPDRHFTLALDLARTEFLYPLARPAPLPLPVQNSRSSLKKGPVAPRAGASQSRRQPPMKLLSPGTQASQAIAGPRGGCWLAAIFLAYLPLERKARNLDAPIQQAWKHLAISLGQSNTLSINFTQLTNNLQQTRESVQLFELTKKEALRRVELPPRSAHEAACAIPTGGLRK